MIRLIPYALAVAIGSWLLWQAHSYGYSRAEAACAAAQEAARRAHAAEVARIADAASVAALEAVEARRTVGRLTDALRQKPRPACPVSDADADGVRAIIDTVRPPTVAPAR